MFFSYGERPKLIPTENNRQNYSFGGPETGSINMYILHQHCMYLGHVSAFTKQIQITSH